MGKRCGGVCIATMTKGEEKRRVGGDQVISTSKQLMLGEKMDGMGRKLE